MDETRICSECGTEKPIGDYAKHPGGRGGRRAKCKVCQGAKVEAWATAHPENLKRNAKRHYDSNAPALRAKALVYRNKDVETARQKRRDWAEKNPVKARALKAKRRALEHGSGGTYTEAEWQAILDKYGHKCLRCGATDNLTADHVLPLARGGSNTADNLQPLCMDCNRRKHDKHIDYRED